MTDMTDPMTKHKHPFTITFLWVWGVCFLVIYGFSPVVIIIEPDSKISLLYLVFLSGIGSLPVGFFITHILYLFRQTADGSKTKKADKTLNIAMGIIIISFFLALTGMHITFYTHLLFGRVLVFLGVSLGVFTIALFWLIKLLSFLKKD